MMEWSRSQVTDHLLCSHNTLFFAHTSWYFISFTMPTVPTASILIIFCQSHIYLITYLIKLIVKWDTSYSNKILGIYPFIKPIPISLPHCCADNVILHIIQDENLMIFASLFSLIINIQYFMTSHFTYSLQIIPKLRTVFTRSVCFILAPTMFYWIVPLTSYLCFPTWTTPHFKWSTQHCDSCNKCCNICAWESWNDSCYKC
jgi:hypothetical protein